MRFNDKELDIDSAEYLNPGADRRVDQKILELVSDFVTPRLTGKRILELGVGDQVWTPKLVNKFPDVTTVDASSELLAEMRAEIVGVHWSPVVSLFEEYRATERFDTVLATYVLEHVDNPKLILKLARREWLRAEGTLAVVVPHALSLHRRLAVIMGLSSYPGQLGETDRRMGHKHCFTAYEMEELIIDAGFDIVEKKGMFTKLLPNIRLVNCSDDQLRGMFNLGLELPIEYSAAIYFLAKCKRS